MSTPEPSWYLITGSPHRIRKVSKDLSRAMKFVRDTLRTAYTLIPSQEKGWFETVCKDMGVTFKESAEPLFEIAPCGTLTTNLKIHRTRCKGCARVEGRRGRSVHGPIHHIATTPGLGGLSLDSLRSLFELRRDEALEIAQSYDGAINALAKMDDLNKRLQTLTAEKVEHQKALENFLAR